MIALARPDMVERADPDNPHAVAQKVLEAEHILRDLAHGIGIRGAEWLLLGEREIVRSRGAIDFGRADDQDHRIERCRPAGFEHVDLRHRVIDQRVTGRGNRDRDIGLGREVEDDIRPAIVNHASSEGVISEIADHHPHIRNAHPRP